MRRADRDTALRLPALGKATKGAEVQFGALSYREWLESWSDSDLQLVCHRSAIIEHFHP
jgi:hypothetical protein